jgi:hypothetical protein
MELIELLELGPWLLEEPWIRRHTQVFDIADERLII